MHVVAGGRGKQMAEVTLARQLASSEPRCRRRATKRLRRWISARMESGRVFEELELLKLWKGLYTCLWMTDQAVVQEEVAGDMAALLQLFTDETSGVLFFSAAIHTLCSEWLRIDRLRLDKFYMLIRKLVYECFRSLEHRGWPQSMVKGCMEVMVGVYRTPSAKGVLYHIGQVFTEELVNNLHSPPPTDVALMLFQPWAELLVNVSEPDVVSTLCDTVMKDLVSADSMTTGLDRSDVAGVLVKCAAERGCRVRTRKHLYSLQSKLK